MINRTKNIVEEMKINIVIRVQRIATIHQVMVLVNLEEPLSNIEDHLPGTKAIEIVDMKEVHKVAGIMID